MAEVDARVLKRGYPICLLCYTGFSGPKATDKQTKDTPLSFCM